MHGLGSIVRMNMTKEEIDAAAARSAAAKPLPAEGREQAEALQTKFFKPETE